MMQFGKALLHQPYYVTKDKAQIKRWLQLQTEVRKHGVRMLETDLFVHWKELKLQHVVSSRGEASPELQALMVTAQRGKMKSSRSLVERRMGLSGLSRKPGFTSSKLLPVPENTEGITEHIHPCSSKTHR